MLQQWRWDQGRLEYFNFNSIRKMAPVLVDLDGIELDTTLGDPLRGFLDERTGLSFSVPETHTIWRNYARVFMCELLATKIENHLVITDLCKALTATGEDVWDIDTYLSFIISRFYYPAPAFQNYNTTDPQIFPFCALLRYLVATHRLTGNASITLEELFAILIGNQCQGIEDETYYLNLKRTGYQAKNDVEERQAREMLAFISQCSFLKWRKNVLYLDVLTYDYEALNDIWHIATPLIRTRHSDRGAEILLLGSISDFKLPTQTIALRELPSDISFTEGKRIRATHLRIERSPQLRKLFLESLPHPILCDMCRLDSNYRYPWSANLIEVHHLLPLSSVLAFEGRDTSFKDLVPLCPNCHKGVHSYYILWLKQYSLDDFLSAEDAHSAYEEAKRAIRLD